MSSDSPIPTLCLLLHRLRAACVRDTLCCPYRAPTLLLFRLPGGTSPSPLSPSPYAGDVGGPFGIIGGGERFAISAVSAGFFASDRFRCEPRGPAYFTSLTPHVEWLRAAVAPEKVKLFEGLL